MSSSSLFDTISFRFFYFGLPFICFWGFGCGGFAVVAGFSEAGGSAGSCSVAGASAGAED